MHSLGSIKVGLLQAPELVNLIMVGSECLGMHRHLAALGPHVQEAIYYLIKFSCDLSV